MLLPKPRLIPTGQFLHFHGLACHQHWRGLALLLAFLAGENEGREKTACSCILTGCPKRPVLRALWLFPAFSIGEDEVKANSPLMHIHETRPHQQGRTFQAFPAYPRIEDEGAGKRWDIPTF